MTSPTNHIVMRGAVDPGQGVEQAWGWLNFLTDAQTTGIEGVTVGTVRIDVGAENPVHIHPNCAEIILFITGTVEHVVGDELVEMSQGDVLIVPAGMPHKARNIGSGPVEMVVIYNSGQRGFELAVSGS